MSGLISRRAEVSEEAERFMRKGILEVYGEDKCTGPLYTTGSDDFHYYTVKRPYLKAVMLGLEQTYNLDYTIRI